VKRSTQVSLVLMTAAGIGGAAYALQPQDRCRPSAPSAVASDTPQNCRSSSHGSSGSSGGSSWFFRSGSGSTSSGTTSTSSSDSGSTTRGGFGSIGRAFASLGG
jgi:hypothetical protein